MLSYHENLRAANANYAANVAFVALRYPDANVFADYNFESAWSEVRAGRDADGYPAGELLGSGLTHEEAYANAAESVRVENGTVSEYRGVEQGSSGQAVHSVQ